MAYHIFTSDENLKNNRSLDQYLGSAVSIDFYWESVGRRLNLPIIASITEKADSENGFVLQGNDLNNFKSEIEILEKFWIHENTKKNIYSDFLENIKIIKEGINRAIFNKATLMIG